MDWTAMTEAARERQSRPRALVLREEVQGIRDALSAAFDAMDDLPEDIRRLLCKLR